MAFDGVLARARLLREVPDLPRWVETRGMLLQSSGKVSYFSEKPLSAVVCHNLLPLISLIGFPAPEAVLSAAEEAGPLVEILVAEEGRRWVRVLQAFQCETAVLFRMGSEERHSLLTGPPVRLLTGSDSLSHLSNRLRHELQVARQQSEVACTLDGDRAVSFCYAGAVTESLWDVSIETLTPYRRQGRARAAARFMMERMVAIGKEPVWGAVHSNLASLGLASSLGLRAVDMIRVFSAPPSNRPWRTSGGRIPKRGR